MYSESLINNVRVSSSVSGLILCNVHCTLCDISGMKNEERMIAMDEALLE